MPNTAAARSAAFTMNTLERIVPPESGRRWVRDPKTPGLALVVMPTGARSWYVYKKVNGRPRKIRLGDFPTLTIDDARRIAAEHLGTIARGVDPSIERKRIRQETTLGELWTLFFEQHAKARKRTWKQDERRYEKHLKTWATRRLSDIARDEVQSLHAKIGREAPYEANRVAALLSKVFSFAIKRGWDGLSPTRGVEKFREQSRSRFLSPDELRAFMASLKAEPHEAVRDALFLLILTGQRRGEVLGMRWEEVDFAEGVWTIPAERYKGRREHRVPLPDAALAIIRERRRKADRDAEFVFPGRGGPLTEIKRPWRAVVKRAGLEGLRIHDIRRTFGSWSVANGTPIYTLKNLLGHKNISTTEVYSRLQLDSLRDAMNATSSRLLAAAEPAAVIDAEPVESKPAAKSKPKPRRSKSKELAAAS
ncbi:MAG: Prophage integrase IntA [Phycisphaerales bacterium]|nr:Prophage integrase IntA [Phycisphaerales bacterium]